MKKKYSIILGNLGNTRDRFCGGYKENPSTTQMLEKASKISDVEGIELVGTWDISPQNKNDIKKAFSDLNLKCVSIIPDLFTDKIYSRGSLSSTNPDVRQKAIDYTKEISEIAIEMDCEILNVWTGQDGYDYMLCADYEKERELLCSAISETANQYPNLKFALEYKPKEPRTHSYLARMADTLLLANKTGSSNVGVTIDTGHGFVGGEVIAESIVLAKEAGGRLFHMHFNDNFTCWDDDMIVGSVHTVCYIEMLYWLERCDYQGWLSMDQYPYREDAVGALSESIAWLKKLQNIVDDNKQKIDELVKIQNPIESSKFMRNLFI